MDLLPHKTNTEEIFWSRVDFPDDIGECWNWNAYTNDRGYGVFCMNMHTAHASRWSYTFTHGSMDEALDADHLCFNTSCVNPMHLEAVPRLTNVRRSKERQRADTSKN